MSFENLTVDRIVVHEVHRRSEGREVLAPVYGTALEAFDDPAQEAFCERINAAMGSASKSLELSILSFDAGSAVDIARTLVDADEQLFLLGSQRVADRLAQAQSSRGVPGGLVVVFTGTAGNPAKRMVGMLKAETHDGFVRRSDQAGRVSLQFLQDLLLTPQTRLYKIGIFVEQEPDTEQPFPAGWRAHVYDDQITAANRLTAAQYFYGSFLGCGFPNSSARKTREFYDHTKEFIRGLDVAPEQKHGLNTALYTYLKVDQNPLVQVSTFALNYLGDAAMRDLYATFMEDRGFSLEAVPKVLTEVDPVLKLRRVTFENGIKLTGPAETFGSVVCIEEIEGEISDDGDVPTWTRITVRQQVRSLE